MKIIFKSLTILLVVLISNSTFAQNSTEMKNEKETVSYALGILMANNLKSDKIEIEIKPFEQAFEKFMNGEETDMTLQEADSVLKAHFAKKHELESAGMKKEGTDFLAANGKKEGVTTLDSGLQYEVLTEGTGSKPGPTDKVTVHYTGTLLDGTVFDSSVERGTPATFGVNQVIAGWTEALQLMGEGAKWKLTIPYNLAYGEKGAGQQIGPFATLIFDVELIKVEKAVIAK